MEPAATSSSSAAKEIKHASNAKTHSGTTATPKGLSTPIVVAFVFVVAIQFFILVSDFDIFHSLGFNIDTADGSSATEGENDGGGGESATGAVSSRNHDGSSTKTGSRHHHHHHHQERPSRQESAYDDIVHEIETENKNRWVRRRHQSQIDKKKRKQEEGEERKKRMKKWMNKKEVIPTTIPNNGETEVVDFEDVTVGTALINRKATSVEAAATQQQPPTTAAAEAAAATIPAAETPRETEEQIDYEWILDQHNFLPGSQQQLLRQEDASSASSTTDAAIISSRRTSNTKSTKKKGHFAAVVSPPNGKNWMDRNLFESSPPMTSNSDKNQDVPADDEPAHPHANRSKRGSDSANNNKFVVPAFAKPSRQSSSSNNENKTNERSNDDDAANDDKKKEVTDHVHSFWPFLKIKSLPFLSKSPDHGHCYKYDLWFASASSSASSPRSSAGGDDNEYIEQRRPKDSIQTQWLALMTFAQTAGALTVSPGSTEVEVAIEEVVGIAEDLGSKRPRKRTRKVRYEAPLSGSDFFRYDKIQTPLHNQKEGVADVARFIKVQYLKSFPTVTLCVKSVSSHVSIIDIVVYPVSGDVITAAGPPPPLSLSSHHQHHHHSPQATMRETLPGSTLAPRRRSKPRQTPLPVQERQMIRKGRHAYHRSISDDKPIRDPNEWLFITTAAVEPASSPLRVGGSGGSIFDKHNNNNDNNNDKDDMFRHGKNKQEQKEQQQQRPGSALRIDPASWDDEKRDSKKDEIPKFKDLFTADFTRRVDYSVDDIAEYLANASSIATKRPRSKKLQKGTLLLRFGNYLDEASVSSESSELAAMMMMEASGRRGGRRRIGDQQQGQHRHGGGALFTKRQPDGSCSLFQKAPTSRAKQVQENLDQHQQHQHQHQQSADQSAQTTKTSNNNNKSKNNNKLHVDPSIDCAIVTAIEGDLESACPRSPRQIRRCALFAFSQKGAGEAGDGLFHQSCQEGGWTVVNTSYFLLDPVLASLHRNSTLSNFEKTKFYKMMSYKLLSEHVRYLFWLDGTVSMLFSETTAMWIEMLNRGLPFIVSRNLPQTAIHEVSQSFDKYHFGLKNDIGHRERHGSTVRWRYETMVDMFLEHVAEGYCEFAFKKSIYKKYLVSPDDIVKLLTRYPVHQCCAIPAQHPATSGHDISDNVGTDCVSFARRAAAWVASRPTSCYRNPARPWQAAHPEPMRALYDALSRNVHLTCVVGVDLRQPWVKPFLDTWYDLTADHLQDQVSFSVALWRAGIQTVPEEYFLAMAHDMSQRVSSVIKFPHGQRPSGVVGLLNSTAQKYGGAVNLKRCRKLFGDSCDAVPSDQVAFTPYK